MTTGDTIQSHIPTADRVFRVFSGGDESQTHGVSDAEEIEEIDFQDMGKMLKQVEVAAALPAASVGLVDNTITVSAVEERFTGFFIDTKPTPVSDRSPTDNIAIERVGGDLPLGAVDESDDIIVYVAPHPRSTKASPMENVPSSSNQRLESSEQTPTAQATFSNAAPPMTFTSTSTAASTSVTPKHKIRQLAARPHSLRKDPRLNSIDRRREQRHAMFGSFGAILSEAHLREEAHERDPRRSEQRRGDSDVDWGDDSDGDAGSGVEKTDTADEEMSSGLEGMEIDADLDPAAMKAFVQGMSGQHLTMDDLADAERMRMEDDDDDGSDESDTSEEDEELEEIVGVEESALVAEPRDKSGGEDESDAEEDEDDSSDEEETPKRGFQARLQRIREKAKGRPALGLLDDEADKDDDDNFSPEFAWGEDDALVAEVQVNQ